MLATALGLVAEAARGARDPWWIIGSAAMALHGAGPLKVGDIDLLMSRADAARLLERHGRGAAPGSMHDKFRSDVFGRLELDDYAVEVMGGFHVHDGESWREVVPSSRVEVRLEDTELFVPCVEELIGMCRLFGRPKDVERERLLAALL
ncbi:hypothetical protein [Allosphingosinicella sp.]|uniref:hypothetical protein n=1 Tax=Allosphingosinicella sp. TaxID=2823234 RepID=UPI003D73CDA3